ncbi:hypothetical protein ACWEQL_25005 [Kitasatospora sp. NPDC004240]
MHRRTAVRAAGALIVTTVLAGCGQDGLAGGTAAVLDGRRIAVGTVEARVAELRQATTGGSADAREQPDGLARRAVTELVLDAVVARAVADHGLTITDGDVAAARTAEELRYGGGGQLLLALTRQGIPSAGVDDYLRQQLGIRRLAEAAGQDADTPVGDATVRRALADASTALRVRINPRYGTWEPDRVALLPDSPPWLTRAG